jgi:hypothetical protein
MGSRICWPCEPGACWLDCERGFFQCSWLYHSSGLLFSAPQQPAAALVRTTTRLVQLSVIATDKKGEPVEDLTAADFVVLDNGRPQKIQIFQKETNQPPANPSRPLPPDTYTNQIREITSAPPSVTMLLLDGLNTEINDQAYARQQAIKFLQQIQPHDRLAVYTLARDLPVAHSGAGGVGFRRGASAGRRRISLHWRSIGPLAR